MTEPFTSWEPVLEVYGIGFDVSNRPLLAVHVQIFFFFLNVHFAMGGRSAD